MCIVILKPKGVDLKESYIANSFANNNHGSGFSASFEGKLVTQKGFFDLDEFLNAYEPFKDQACLLHFRIATAGEIDQENCHPFLVNDDVSFAHNGIINITHPKDKSDTWSFVEHVLKPMSKIKPDMWNDPLIKTLLEKAMSSGSKAACLFSSGEHIIFNEAKSQWEDGCWFSNYSFRYAKSKTYTYGNHHTTYHHKPQSRIEHDNKVEQTNTAVQVIQTCFMCGMLVLNKYLNKDKLCFACSNDDRDMPEDLCQTVNNMSQQHKSCLACRLPEVCCDDCDQMPFRTS